MPMAGHGGDLLRVKENLILERLDDKFDRKFLVSPGYNRLRISLDSCGVATSLPNSFAILTTLSTN